MENREQLSLDVQPESEARREMLRKIGAALAASSVAMVASSDTMAEQDKTQPPISLPTGKTIITIPQNLRTAVEKVDKKREFAVFFSHPTGEAASLVVVDAVDQATVKAFQGRLGGAPAVAKVIDGIVHVNLGAASKGRCNADSNSAAAFKFNPRGSIETGPIIRSRG